MTPRSPTQRARNLGRLLSALLLSGCVLVIPAALAHPVPRRMHDRVIRIEIAQPAITIRYRLEVDHFTVVLDDLPVFDDKIDLKNLNTPDQFYGAFIDCYAPVLARNLDIELDGERVKLECLEKSFRITDANGHPLDHIRCDFVFRASWKLAAAKAHVLSFREGNYLLEAGGIKLSTAGLPPVVFLEVNTPDLKLQEKPARDLKPGDDARLRRASARFLLHPLHGAEPMLSGVLASAPAGPLGVLAALHLCGERNRTPPLPEPGATESVETADDLFVERKVEKAPGIFDFLGEWRRGIIIVLVMLVLGVWLLLRRFRE